MDNGIKNYVITISGEPGSGKSTVVKALNKKYDELGKTVHVISVGKIFREVAIAKYKEQFPECKNPSIEDVNTDKRFKDELNKLDNLIDTKIAEHGREINAISRPDDVYIIDSRLAWKTVENAFDIRLTVSDEVAGKRVFFDKTRGKEDQYDSLEEAIQDTKLRKEGEVKRYKDSYGLDLTDTENYNLIIDTSNITVDEISDIIVDLVEKDKNGETYPKYWKTCKLR